MDVEKEKKKINWPGVVIALLFVCLLKQINIQTKTDNYYQEMRAE